MLREPCCCVGGAVALTGEEDDVSIHCAVGAGVDGVGAEGGGGGGGPTEVNMDGGGADEEGALQPGEICSAFRMRSGCCRSLQTMRSFIRVVELFPLGFVNPASIV